jgi:hypothetical protein
MKKDRIRVYVEGKSISLGNKEGGKEESRVIFWFGAQELLLLKVKNTRKAAD